MSAIRRKEPYTLPGLMFDDLRFSWIAEVENLQNLRIMWGVMLA